MPELKLFRRQRQKVKVLTSNLGKILSKISPNSSVLPTPVIPGTTTSTLNLLNPPHGSIALNNVSSPLPMRVLVYGL